MLFSQIQPANDCPLPDFGCAEHLLLWACRRSRYPQAEFDELAVELGTCGENGFEVLHSLDLFIAAISASGLLPHAVGAPRAHILTLAERQMPTLMAACQAGQDDVAHHALEAIGVRETRPCLQMAAGILVKAIAENALEIHPPRCRSSNRCPRATLAP